ncbi:MAG: outer membrane beta-barrel family protein [Bacteroidota bacterium]
MFTRKLPAICLLLSLISVPLFSQVIVRNSNPDNPTITGKVIDASTNEPVEFATVALLNTRDSSLVSGGATNSEGIFKIVAKPGTYMMKISFVSYETKLIPSITLTSSTPIVKVGDIILSADVKALEEVEITGERSRLEMDLDKRVFVVQKDLSNIGGSASDVLDNIPSVMVDAEGNVSLRGNENVRILINGQQSGMLGVDGVSGLRSLPANMIERVEVVTNPSARYDAEGNAGVINIVLKKNQKKGFNGNFDFALGYPQQYNAAINLNYRMKDLNFFVNYGLAYRESPGRGFTRRDFTQDGVFNRLDQDQDYNRSGLSNTIRLGADYSPDNKNTFTGSLMYQVANDRNLGQLDFREYDFNNNLIGASFREADEEEEENNLEYALNYKRTFDQKGRELIASLTFNSGPEEELSDITELILNPIDLTPDFTADPLLQRSDNLEDQSNLIFQADYVQPLGEKGKLEAGLKSSLRDINNDYFVEEQDDAGNWIRLPELSNEFIYNEDIHAVYAIYSNKFERFTYQVGLRTEITDISTNLVETDEANNKQYTNFFPSAHITYDLQKGNSMQVSYSRRLQRPSFRYLIPFFNYNNPQTIRGGNPDLDPEFTDSYEVAYIKNWKSSSLTSSVYYRRSQGVIQWISRVNEEGITFRSPENLASGEDFGVEFILDKELTEWWNINGSFNFFRSIVEAGNLAELEEGLSADTYSWMSRVNSRMKLPWGIEFQLMLNYRAPIEQPQGKRKSITSLDLGFNKDIMKQKATVAFRVSDVFNSRLYRSETFGENFFLDSEYQRRVRSFVLSFSYRLNQKKSRKGRGNRQRGGGDFEGM